MADCKIVNASVVDAVTKINEISASYKTAGEELVNQITAALAEMEGASKDAFKQYLDTNIKTFVETDIPEAITGMANVLELNRTNFEKVDAKIAASITSGK